MILPVLINLSSLQVNFAQLGKKRTILQNTKIKDNLTDNDLTDPHEDQAATCTTTLVVKVMTPQKCDVHHSNRGSLTKRCHFVMQKSMISKC